MASPPLLFVQLQHGSDKTFDLLALLCPILSVHLELPFQDLGPDRVDVVDVERRVAANQDVENHPCRPNVTLLVIFPIQNLRRVVVTEILGLFHVVRFFQFFAHFEITNFHLDVAYALLQVDCLKSQFTVDYVLFVKVLNSFHYLNENCTS